MLKENIFELNEFFKPQRVISILGTSANKGSILIEIQMIKDRLNFFIKHEKYLPKESPSTRPFDEKVCQALEKIISKVKEDPKKFKKSSNPLIKIVSAWAEAGTMLTEI